MIERTIAEEEHMIRETEQRLDNAEANKNQLLQLIKMIEAPVNAKEKEKALLKIMIANLDAEIELYKSYNKPPDELKKDIKRILHNRV